MDITQSAVWLNTSDHPSIAGWIARRNMEQETYYKNATKTGFDDAKGYVFQNSWEKWIAVVITNNQTMDIEHTFETKQKAKQFVEII